MQGIKIIKLLVVATSITIMSVCWFSWSTLAQNNSVYQRHEIAEFRGEGDYETTAFKANGHWEIYWKAEDQFQLLLIGSMNPPTRALSKVEALMRSLEQTRPIKLENSIGGEGRIQRRLGGEFILKIKSKGVWSIQLFDLISVKDFLDTPYTGAP